MGLPLAGCGVRDVNFVLEALKEKSCLEERGLFQQQPFSRTRSPGGLSPYRTLQIRATSPKMAGLFGSASATSQANTLGDLSKDVALNSPPEDSVSDISFSPQSEHLAVASWDKKVRIYEITQTGGSNGKAFFDHEAPVLSCHWSPVST